jgi:hypothetical protein
MRGDGLKRHARSCAGLVRRTFVLTMYMAMPAPGGGAHENKVMEITGEKQ